MRKIFKGDTHVPLAISPTTDSLAEVIHVDRTQEIATHAVSDIFDVEKLTLPKGTHMYNNYMSKGVDREGNFYCVAAIESSSPIANGVGYDHAILKYDQESGEFVFFAPFDNEDKSAERQFCFDDKNNLCYISGDKLRRIKANGQAMVDQPLEFSTIKYRQRHFKGISAAVNGGLFFLVEYLLEDYSTVTRLYRLGPGGLLGDTKVASLPTGDGRGLYKASGAVLYTYDGDKACSRVNIYTKEVTPVSLRFPVKASGIATSPDKGNMYAIEDNYVMQLRPNAVSDLTIGAIPDRRKDETGQFVDLKGDFKELYVSWDASVFYTFDKSGEGDCIYRLTF